MLDLDRIRRDTPAVSRRCYLHNAGAALTPAPIITAMKAYLDLEAEIGGYAAADQERVRLEAVYESVARLINAAPDEIALVENATVAWQMAFYAQRFQPGDRIITCQAEYGANYVAFLQMARRTGVRIDVVPNDASGELDVDALARMIDGTVKLVAVTWVPTNGGLVNPAAAIGAITRRAGIPFLLDACQAVGQMPVDVAAIGCDMLSATGRKFLRGPRGTGFLYVRRELLQTLEPPMIDHYGAEWVARDQYRLRPDARRFENWENNYAARLGLGLAVTMPWRSGWRRLRRAAITCRAACAQHCRPFRASACWILAATRRPSSAFSLMALPPVRWLPQRCRRASPSGSPIRRAPGSMPRRAHCRPLSGLRRTTTIRMMRSNGLQAFARHLPGATERRGHCANAGSGA